MMTPKAIYSLLLTKLSNLKLYLLISIGFICLFFMVFFLLQNDTVYNLTLGNITGNYVNESGVISKQKVPFTTITNDKLLHWDAAHYRIIKETGYRMTSESQYYLYAFFPMFPAVWNLINANEITISLVNYLMFSISLIILFALYKSQYESRRERIYRFIMLFCSPMLVVFIMPYTEATFFLAFTVAIYGLIKNKYWLYFIGLMLAAMTRSTIVILILSITFSYVLLILKYKRIDLLFKQYIISILPALIGLFAVLIIHKLYGSENLFIFIDALQTWDSRFRIPSQLFDWSHESFAITMAIICFIPLAITYLARVAITSLSPPSPPLDASILRSESFKKELLVYVSVLYCLGAFFSILLYKGGALNGIPRYIICSPFFYIIVFYSSTLIKSVPSKTVIYFLSTLSLFGIFFLTTIPYSAKWNFSDFGFFIFLAFIWLTMFFNHIKFPALRIAVLTLLFLNIIWNTFLFNSFLNNAWIFT